MIDFDIFDDINESLNASYEFFDDIDGENIIIEFDDDTEIVQETYKPYDEWLKKHQYDPSNNTLIINGKRVDAGRVGSKKERNRLNKFLRENGFDLKTETILSNIPDGKGGRKRIDFGVGFLHPNETQFLTTTDQLGESGADSRTTRIATGGEHSTPIPDDQEGFKREYDRRMSEIRKLEQQVDDINFQIKEERANKNRREVIKRLTKARNDARDKADDLEYDLQRMLNSADGMHGGIAMSKDMMMKKPAVSNYVLKHEEGHIAKGELSPETRNEFGEKRNAEGDRFRDFAVDQYGRYSPEDADNVAGNPHFKGYEFASDEYSTEHNPHSNSGREVGSSLNWLNERFKKVGPAQLEREIRQEIDRYRGYIAMGANQADESFYRSQIANLEDALKHIPDMVKSRSDMMKTEAGARASYAAAVNARRQQEQQAIDANKRKLRIEQLQQQIDSGKLTPQQVAAARKKIYAIQTYDLNNGSLRTISSSGMSSKNPVKDHARATSLVDQTTLLSPNNPISVNGQPIPANQRLMDQQQQKIQSAYDAASQHSAERMDEAERKKKDRTDRMRSRIQQGLPPVQTSKTQRRNASNAYRQQQYDDIGREINDRFTDFKNGENQPTPGVSNPGRQAALQRSMDRAPTQDTSQPQTEPVEEKSQSLSVDNPTGKPEDKSTK